MCGEQEERDKKKGQFGGGRQTRRTGTWPNWVPANQEFRASRAEPAIIRLVKVPATVAAQAVAWVAVQAPALGGGGPGGRKVVRRGSINDNFNKW